MTEHKRILVVDDEPMVLFILHDALQALGSDYEIVTARNGLEALSSAQKSPFDLVITDLSMPGMGGIELTEAIKTQRPATPVIWITAYDSHDARADAKRLHVYSCRDKPLEISEILCLAKTALGIKNGGSTP
jgi:CheY-like chemotaxis protein